MRTFFRSKLIITAILLAISLQGISQKSYPRDYFRSPVDFKLLLSGTFGEIRANHFHSGIDIKTNGATGSPVYAVADGYVSRIKISAYGYGNAFYITHPNGYVSVYGHLDRFNKTIAEYVKKEQYSRESFEIEVFPAAGVLPVKKGDLIAYSGNSGSSGGPHLHLEIRDGATERTINPLLFGFDVKDMFRPRITSIKIYPEGENSKVNGSAKPVRYLVEGWGTEHRLANNPTIKLSGDISFAIQVFDQQNDTENKNGPYGITLYIDSVEMFQFRMENFSFDETRYVNSLLDYEEYMRNDVRLQRTKVDPGNKLDIYGDVKNKGVFSFNDSLTHVIRYEVTDAAGNIGVLSFKVRAEKIPNSKFQIPESRQIQNSKFKIQNFRYDAPNHFEKPYVILDAPAGSFYDSFEFRYDTAKRITGTYSAVQKIHDKYTPVQDYLTLSIKPKNLPLNLEDKALVVKIKDDGVSYSSAGGKYERNGFVVTKIREFGNYSIAIDTIPPKIKAVQPETFAKLSAQKQVKLTVSDELSGIAAYRGLLNGNWVLLEYDAKNDMLIYNIDERLLPGKNNFLLEVVDGKNNKSFYRAVFFK